MYYHKNKANGWEFSVHELILFINNHYFNMLPSPYYLSPLSEPFSLNYCPMPASPTSYYLPVLQFLLRYHLLVKDFSNQPSYTLSEKSYSSQVLAIVHTYTSPGKWCISYTSPWLDYELHEVKDHIYFAYHYVYKLEPMSGIW